MITHNPIKLPLWRKLLYAAVTFLLLISTLEIIQRFRHPPARYESMYNSSGFRSTEFDLQKPPGTVRILFVGGSTTFGVGGPVEETFPYMAGEILKKRLPESKIETINIAKTGKASQWIIGRIEETLYLEPDVMVVMTGYNDALNVYEGAVSLDQEGSLNLKPWPIRLDRFIANRSVLYRSAREKIAILRHGSPVFAFDMPGPPGWEKTTDRSDWFSRYPRYFRENLEKIVKTTQENRIKLVFIRPPLSPRRVTNDPHYGRAFLLLMEELLGVADRYNVPVIDLTDFYSANEKAVYTIDGIHFSLQTKQKIAAIIADFFVKNPF